jgi:DNA mismatch repair protein MutS2
MGFNEETLEPTYLLRTGAPGKSAGLDIASRLGLPPRLIDRARHAMSSTERDIAEFLRQLETRIGEANREAEELRGQKQALEARELALTAQAEKRLAEKLKEFEKDAEEARRRFEREAREAIESVFSQPEQRKQAERALRQVARTQREFRESVEALDPRKPQVKAPPREEIREGSRVRLRDVSDPARVRKVLANGNLEVDVGFLKMQVAREDIVQVLPDTAATGATLPQGVSFHSAGPRWDTLSREVNVIGRTADEAFEEVDRCLDAAFMAGVMRLRIVHGHGMGVLKRMVQNLLKADPRVEKFYPASPAEGGTGATIAELKVN